MSAHEYDIEGDYGYGWEVVTCEESWPEAKDRIREYRDNEPGVRFRIHRVKADA